MGAFNNYGPNFTQFRLPTPLEWTIVDILQITYAYHVTKRGLSTEHLPTSSCPRSY